MTSLSASLTISDPEFKLNKSLSFSAAIPNEQVVIPGPDHTSMVLSQKDGVASAGFHVPFFGLVTSKSFEEKGTYTINETWRGCSITGTVYVS